MTTLRRILHVEDVPAIQLVARIALERLGGFEVLSCASGQEALAQLASFAPDMLLIDAQLPDMDGAELLRRCLALSPGRPVPVVFLTGHLEKDQRERLRQLGAAAILDKPFDPLRLSDRLRDIWQTTGQAATADRPAITESRSP